MESSRYEIHETSIFKKKMSLIKNVKSEGLQDLAPKEKGSSTFYWTNAADNLFFKARKEKSQFTHYFFLNCALLRMMLFFKALQIQ